MFIVKKQKSCGDHKKKKEKVDSKAYYEESADFFCNMIFCVCFNSTPPGPLAPWRTLTTPANLISSQGFRRKCNNQQRSFTRLYLTAYKSLCLIYVVLNPFIY